MENDGGFKKKLKTTSEEEEGSADIGTQPGSSSSNADEVGLVGDKIEVGQASGYNYFTPPLMVRYFNLLWKKLTFVGQL